MNFFLNGKEQISNSKRSDKDARCASCIRLFSRRGGIMRTHSGDDDYGEDLDMLK